jgi:enediyne biosynthesis protein E4
MVNEGPGQPFRNATKALGVDFISISWGANFADFDHDGDEDLFVANGDLNPNVVPLANYYFVNNDGTFSDQAHVVGLNDYGLGRGSVVFDMENDGDLDILVVNQRPVKNYPVESRTKLFRNDLSSGNWLKLTLKGNASDKNGLGCRVRVVAGGRSMIREIDGGSSHESQNSVVAHFGIGDATAVDSIIVGWIGGEEQILTQQEANILLTVTQPEVEKNHTWLYATILGIVVVVGIGVRRRRSRKG